MEMEEGKKQQPRLRRRASGIYIPEQAIGIPFNIPPRPSTGLSPKTHSAYNHNDDNLPNPHTGFSMKHGEDPTDPHPTMKITSLAKPVTFTTTGHGILNVLPVSSVPSHYANNHSGNHSARSCQSGAGSQKSSSSHLHPMTPTSHPHPHPPSHFASSPRIKSNLAASSYNDKPLRQNFIKHGKKSSLNSNSVNIDFVPEAKPAKHPSRSNSNYKKQFTSYNNNEQRERSLQIRKMYKNTTNFYIENETEGQFTGTGTGRNTKTNSNVADIATRTATPPHLSFQRNKEGDGDVGDCIEIQKSVSRCTVDGLGFDLETIDLTNDTDRELASTAKYKHRRKSTKKPSSKTNKSPDSDTHDWCPDNFSNSAMLSKESPDSSTSGSSSGSGTGTGTASSDEDLNSNSLESDIETTKNRNKPASRYISVESLVLQDNFNALTSTSSTKSSSNSRSRPRATGGTGTLPISAAAAGKNKLKQKSQKQQHQESDDSILDSENSDDHEDEDNKDNATIINKHINVLEFSASDEIPQVKVVWTTPPQQRSPRLVNGGAVVETPLTSPSSTADPQSISILDFFTRTEEGVIKEGRYENVEPIISKFFNKSDEENSNANTTVANSCINLKNVMDNMDEFVLQPAAVGYDVQCRVTRDRKGVDRGLYPTYYMHLERPDGRKVSYTRNSVVYYEKRLTGFSVVEAYVSTAKYVKSTENPVLLLTGRKRKKSTTSNYLISTDAADLSRDSNHYVGKVRSNLLGTQFTIYDNGQSHKRLGLFQTYGANATLTREELAAVIYEPNVLGFKGPRKMKILIPEMKNEAKRREHRPEREKDSVLELFKQGGQQEYFELRNKAPIWNDDNQSFVLNFHGRVTQASVKNFQIIHENKEEYVILQFGRVASDLFTMDYRYPLCALQAFAIVLTSFDNKLACE